MKSGDGFLRIFEKRVKKNIRLNNLLSKEDRVVVALSGGKDSATCLYILRKLQEKKVFKELLAITIDLGIPELKKSLEKAKKICEMLEVEHHIYSLKEVFGYSMNEIWKKIQKLSSKESVAAPCSYCGVLRRRILNQKARELKASKIATGHNLDDEIQTALMNFIRGDLLRIAKLGAKTGVANFQEFIPRIKPLRVVLEKDIETYAKLRKIPFSRRRCPYSKLAFRNTMRLVLEEIEKEHPGSKYQLLSSVDRLASILRKEMKAATARNCKICGEISSQEICKFCQLMKELKLIK